MAEISGGLYSPPCTSDAHIAFVGRSQLIGEVGLKALYLRRVETPAHQSLDGVNGVAGIRDHLAFGDLPKQPISLFGKRHDGRCRPATQAIGDDLNRRSLQNRNARVRRAKINSDDFAHNYLGAEP